MHCQSNWQCFKLVTPLPNMEQWENHYRQFLDIAPYRNIFQQQGFVEGTDQDKSCLFYKYFINNNVDYVGVGNRRRPKPNKEILNTSFLEYTQNKGIDWVCGYRQFITNAEAEYKSVSQYDRAQPNIDDEEAWNLSEEWTIRHFGPGKMMGARTVDFETAWREMDKQTSPGWPHNMVHKTKAKMFCDLRHMGIIGDYWDMIGRSQEEQEWVPVWQCSEKVEMRELEKIVENKVRTFTCAPVEHSVALNRVCLDMNNRFYAAHNNTWSFVGANKFSKGFHNLRERLKKHPNAFELDETAYDRSLFLRALGDMVDIRFTMLSEDEKTLENYDRLTNLYESIIHSVIIMENGEMFRKHTGGPSGSANTIVDNTIILYRLCAYAWIVLTKKANKEQQDLIKQTVHNVDVTKRVDLGLVENYGYGGFHSHVEAALNGDDNTFTVSDEMVCIYNATTIAEIWSSLKIKTSTPNAAFGQKVENVSFLSQRFTTHRGLWLPTPETNKVFSSIMYNSEFNDVRWHLLRACALRIDSWANVEMRKIIQGYIEFLWEQNKVMFSQDVVMNFGGAEVGMKHIMDMWKSDNWIFKLYSSYESQPLNSLAIMTQVLKTKENLEK